jgi:hypothetical protein
MDLRDFYFGELVSQADMDEIQANAQAADNYELSETDMVGIVDGLTMTEHAPQNLTVDITAGTAYNDSGTRMPAAAVVTNLDCSVDEYGNLTDPAALNQRYLSVFIRPYRRLADLETDDNGLPVYTRHYEESQIVVRAGTPALIVGPLPTPPVKIADYRLIGDILMPHGMAMITNADISFARRDDYINEGAGTYRFSTPRAALIAIFGTGASYIPITMTAKWNGAAAVPTWTNVEDAVNGIITDLADDDTTAGQDGCERIGHDAVAAEGGAKSAAKISLAKGSLHLQLVALLNSLNHAAHLGTAETVSAAWTHEAAVNLSTTAALIQGGQTETASIETVHCLLSAYHEANGYCAIWQEASCLWITMNCVWDQGSKVWKAVNAGADSVAIRFGTGTAGYITMMRKDKDDNPANAGWSRHAYGAGAAGWSGGQEFLAPTIGATGFETNTCPTVFGAGYEIVMFAMEATQFDPGGPHNIYTAQGCTYHAKWNTIPTNFTIAIVNGPTGYAGVTRVGAPVDPTSQWGFVLRAAGIGVAALAVCQVNGYTIVQA